MRLKIPNDIHASTLYDKIAYVQGGIMTLQEFKESEGANPEEVRKFIGDMEEQQVLFGKVKPETDSKLSIEKIANRTHLLFTAQTCKGVLPLTFSASIWAPK